MLKHGHENFTLEILEYCSITELFVREQYYLDLLKPEYNILKFAYSTKGYKHSAETIALLKSKMTPLKNMKYFFRGFKILKAKENIP